MSEMGNASYMSITKAIGKLQDNSRSHERVLSSNIGHDRRSDIPDLPVRLTTKDDLALGLSELLLYTIKVAVGNDARKGLGSRWAIGVELAVSFFESSD